MTKALQKKWKDFVRKIDTKTDDYGTVLMVSNTYMWQMDITIEAVRKEML